MHLTLSPSLAFLVAHLFVAGTFGKRRQTDQTVFRDCLGVEDMTVCDPTAGGVCRNNSCVSACSTKSYKQCNCPTEEDRFCYLCCGSTTHQCKPAQDYQIYKPNGEVWERNSCGRCRSWPNGLPCDDRDTKRVCHNGKCVANICHGRPEGSYCDLQKFRVCTDGECHDPCKEYGSQLLTCECDDHTEDRCQLCCFDPATRRCENAFQKYSIKNKDRRPIYRDGLSCRRGLTCNKYGLCSGATFGLSNFLKALCLWRLLVHMILTS